MPRVTFSKLQNRRVEPISRNGGFQGDRISKPSDRTMQAVQRREHARWDGYRWHGRWFDWLRTRHGDPAPVREPVEHFEPQRRE